MDPYVALKVFKESVQLGGAAPSICKNCLIQYGSGKAVLRWGDPDDTTINGQVLATWAKTIVTRKQGGYPEYPADGVVVVENTTRNNYRINGYEDIVSDSQSWYYRAFPVADNGSFSVNDKNKFTQVRVYGYRKAVSNSDPASRIAYTDDAELMTPAHMDFANDRFDYGSWEDAFFMPRPCMLKYTGEVDYYLDPMDFSKKADGTASAYNDPNYAGNVMIEFPLVWIKRYTEGGYHYVKISNVQIDSSYKAYAHTNHEGNIIQHIYMAAYDGCNISGRLRSISGQAPTHDNTAAAEDTLVAANNTAGGVYNIWQKGVLADVLLVRDLLTLIGKSTNSQAVFGQGYTTGGSQASHLHNSGAHDKKGMFYGSTSTSVNVKVFGIENFWGNIWKRISGWINANGTQKVKLTWGQDDSSTTDGYNLTGSGYISIPNATPGGTSGGYISATEMTGYGEFPKTVSGSETTYECDGLWFNNSQVDVALVGGNCNNGALCGAFCSSLNDTASDSSWYIGAAVSCKPLS